MLLLSQTVLLKPFFTQIFNGKEKWKTFPWLIFELQLKSTNDFDAEYDIVMNAGLGDYMQTFVAIQPGDWPCQFYCRQIIYHCLKKFISFTPMCAQVIQEHSTYSYPPMAGSDKEESLEVKIDLSAPYPVCHSSSAHLLIWPMTS